MGYECVACGNTRSFAALKRYWHKVEVDAEGMVLETHGIRSGEDEPEEVECRRCGASCEARNPASPGPAPGPSSPSRYRCLTCDNETEFHRFYVEEAREVLNANGEWEISCAWEFADGAETTDGAICTRCAAAGRDAEVVEIESSP